MKDRQRLIDEVKAEYARLADRESRDSFVDMTGNMPPEAYYEALLAEVLAGIQAGRFDDMQTGRQIVEAVTGNHQKWGIQIQ